MMRWIYLNSIAVSLFVNNEVAMLYQTALSYTHQPLCSNRSSCSRRFSVSHVMGGEEIYQQTLSAPSHHILYTHQPAPLAMALHPADCGHFFCM